jgi:hexosaminidase
VVRGARRGRGVNATRVARAVAVSAALAAVLAAEARAAPPPGLPATVPAVRSWSPAPGTFTPRRDVRIVVAPEQRSRLLGEARTLAGDLGALLGRRVEVAARGGVRVRAGDVGLALARPGASLGREGYELRAGASVQIAAPTSAGVFYGGRTLLQLLRSPGGAACGIARDAPLYRERGLMLDVARKTYTAAELRRQIRTMAALKLNTLQLHLSDDEGFMVQSRRYPELATAGALSRRAVSALVAYAARRHVEIVPEIDMPGHMGAALRGHPELQLRDASGAARPDKLDITLSAARAFARNLIRDLEPLFPGRWWHTGSDEFLGANKTASEFGLYPQLASYARSRLGPGATGPDAVLDFDNLMGEVVRAAGKTQRVWSDGMAGGRATRLDTRAVVQWWENRVSPSPAALVAAGYRVVNMGWWPLYLVTGGPVRDLRADLGPMYSDWEPWAFEGLDTARWTTGVADPRIALARGDARQLGASLAVWNDRPNSASVADAATQALPRLRIVAQKTWGSLPAAADVAAFEALADRVAPAG